MKDLKKSEVATECLEREARRRAMEDVVQDYSDAELIFLLKTRRPNIYREGTT